MTHFNGLAMLQAGFATVLLLCAPHLYAQQMPAGIGSIEGDNAEVKTPVGAGIESHSAPTVVASGSEVTLSSGDGRILLDGGGEISICGPAHFTLFKSKEAVTLALDYGRVHPSIDASSNLTIFTPIIVATPIAISGAHRDTTIGLDQHGAMCVLTEHGAMRIQQQLSDQSLVIPQGDSANLVDGQVESVHADVGSCTCQYSRAAAAEPPPIPAPNSDVRQEVVALSPPLPPERKQPATIATPPPTDIPVYTVDLPPLVFDKSGTAPPPEPSPESMALVREVQVQPDTEFHGHVNPIAIAGLQPAGDTARPTTQPDQADRTIPVATPNGLLLHIRNLFRAIGGRPPCEGSGCGK